MKPSYSVSKKARKASRARHYVKHHRVPNRLASTYKDRAPDAKGFFEKIKETFGRRRTGTGK